MSISNELFYSILAMDAYNRGYGSGIEGLGGEGSKVGNAVLGKDAEQLLDQGAAEALNFYAIAYDYGGETIISYRGTDDPLGELPNAGSGDLLSGWVIGAGFTQNTQTLLAEQFYERATGRTVFEQAAFIDPPVDILPTVILTGHSLGGGLAGYIASLSGDDALIFDNMPYGAATIIRWLVEVGSKSTAELTYTISDALRMLEGDPEVPLPDGMALPDFQGAEAIYLIGEALETIRAISQSAFVAATSPYAALIGETVLTTLERYFPSPETPQLEIPLIGPTSLGNIIIAEIAAYVADVDVDPSQREGLERYGTPLVDTVDRHSISALIVQQYATESFGNDGAWSLVYDSWFDLFFNDTLGAAAGFDEADVNGRYSESGKMLSAIAYSAIDEGTLIFGNTGIRALFDDMNELGLIKENATLSSLDDIGRNWFDYRTLSVSFELSFAAVQFAGQMALQQVDAGDIGPETTPLEGIFGFSSNGVETTSDSALNETDAAEETNGAEVLTVSLSADLWGLNVEAGAPVRGPDTLFDWIDNILLNVYLGDNTDVARLENEATLQDLDSLFTVQYEDGLTSRFDGDSFSQRYFNRIDLPLQSGPQEITLADMPIDSASSAGLFVGTDAGHRVAGTDGNTVFVMGAGNDVVNGKGGNDIIFGGAGGDQLRAGWDMFDLSDLYWTSQWDDTVEWDSSFSDNDIIIGGANDDTLYDAAGFDILLGGNDNDTVYSDFDTDIARIEDFGGEPGSFGIFEPGTLIDVFDGGSGTDTLVVNDYDSFEVIVGEFGGETAIAIGYEIATDLAFNFEIIQNAWRLDFSTLQQAIGYNGETNTITFGDDTLTGSDTYEIVGTDFDEIFEVGESSMSILGRGGKDVFYGGQNTFFSGGNGNDEFYVGEGVSVSGGAGDDIIVSGGGGAVLRGGSGKDTITAQLGDRVSGDIHDSLTVDGVQITGDDLMFDLNQAFIFPDYLDPDSDYAETFQERVDALFGKSFAIMVESANRWWNIPDDPAQNLWNGYLIFNPDLGTHFDESGHFIKETADAFIGFKLGDFGINSSGYVENRFSTTVSEGGTLYGDRPVGPITGSVYDDEDDPVDQSFAERTGLEGASIDHYLLVRGLGNGSGEPDVLNFNAPGVSAVGFGGSQDNGIATISDDGTSVALTDNAWKAVLLDTVITENTVLRFDFDAGVEGEIHAIGFDTDDNLSEGSMFQLFGTQDWGIQNFNDQYLAGSGTQTYEIAIGQFYTGSFDRLVFAMDDDAGVGGNSVFSNIEIFEGIPPVLQINGESSPISSYGGSQNQGFAEVSEDDARVVLSDNTWQDVLRDVVITEDTVLRFEFRSDVEGEIHAIGFDTDDDLSEEFMFQLSGTQEWGLQYYSDQYATGTGIQSFEIAVGQFYTGNFDRLVFAMDDDADLGGDSVFSNIEIFEAEPRVVLINGEDSVITAYGGPQNQGMASVSADGATVTLSDNAWQDVMADVVITEDTVLRFDFSSDVEGEIHAIGFDNDNDLSEGFMFQLSGTQGWGLQDFSDQYVTGSGTQSFEIAVGQFYTGTFDRLVFAMDDDAGLGGDSVFTNIEIVEVPRPGLVFDGIARNVSTYGGTQDKGTAVVSDNGASVTLANNAWKDMPADVVITEDTVLRFDFSSDVEGEIHGIGFDNDNELSDEFMFQLSGTQGWGIQDFNNQYVTGSGIQSYEIAIGEFYTGTFDRFVFAMDDDAGLGGTSTFSNIEFA